MLSLGLGQSRGVRDRGHRQPADPRGVARLPDSDPHPSLSDREIFDLIYQLLDIAFSLGPVLLVCFLLWMPQRPHLSRLGLAGCAAGVRRHPGPVARARHRARRPRDLPRGPCPRPRRRGEPGGARCALVDGSGAAALGPARRAAGGDRRARLPVRPAARRRLGHGGRSSWAPPCCAGAITCTRASAASSATSSWALIFGWLYTRWGRVLPFVIAHAVIDAAIFVGYPWAAATFPALFGLPA